MSQEDKILIADLEEYTKDDLIELLEENEVEFDKSANKPVILETAIKTLADDYEPPQIEAENFVDPDVAEQEKVEDNSKAVADMEELRGRFLEPHEVQYHYNQQRVAECKRIQQTSKEEE